MTYIDSLRKGSNYTLTENGAKTNNSSLNRLVDFFGTGGAYRSRSEKDIETLFSQAYAENGNDAIKILMYLRDIRGGQGERRVFRVILKYIGKLNLIPLEKINEFCDYIVEYGRYDDLYALFGTSYEKYALNYMFEIFNNDLKSECPTLLGKWLKSENTSSKQSIELAKKTREHFKLKPRQYRQALSKLREKLKIIERNLTSKNYDFDYSKIPSKAMLQYRRAFYRNDEDKYTKYLDSLEKGEIKINTSTLYPYEIIKNVYSQYGYGNYFQSNDYDKQIDLTWKNLPDYVKDNGNSIVVADTSGSMSGTPMDVSLSLAIYMAERNKGLFKDYMITFSSFPKFVKLEGLNIYDKVKCIPSIISDTNIQRVFDLLLNTAFTEKVSNDEMVKNIYVVSDMEFNQADESNYKTNFEIIKQKYEIYGYDMPNLIFWNVNSRNNNVPVTYDEVGTMLVSGCSPTIFKQAIKKVTPLEFMYQVINSDRYKNINIIGGN